MYNIYTQTDREKQKKIMRKKARTSETKRAPTIKEAERMQSEDRDREKQKRAQGRDRDR